jgi:hypothetical protein
VTVTDQLDDRIAQALAHEANRMRVDPTRAELDLERRLQATGRRRPVLALAAAAAASVATIAWLAAGDDGSTAVFTDLTTDTALVPSPSAPSTAPSTLPPDGGSPTTSPGAEPEQAPLLVATGWGVVSVDEHGNQSVVEDLSNGTGAWFSDTEAQSDPFAVLTVEIEGQEVIVRVSTVLSDLQGGVVYGADNAIVWLPADGGRTILDWARPLTLGSDISESTNLDDVAVIDGVPHVIVTHTTIDTGENFSGSARLTAISLASGQATTVESYEWEDMGDDWQYYGQVSYANGVYSVVREWNQGFCTWIDLLDQDGTLLTGQGPYPRPADPNDCPYGSGNGLAGAALSDSGDRLAVLQTERRTVEIYSITGELLDTADPTTPTDDWFAYNGLDLADSALVLQRRAACQASLPTSRACGPFASASFARGPLRRPVSPLAPTDALWVAVPPPVQL